MYGVMLYPWILIYVCLSPSWLGMEFVLARTYDLDDRRRSQNRISGANLRGSLTQQGIAVSLPVH